MPIYCLRDDGWPKKRCYVHHKNGQSTCRYWSKGITNDGCGFHMWQQAAKDGMSVSYPPLSPAQTSDNKATMEVKE